MLLTRELLHESGSVFVQIGDENVHHVRELMDEVFGKSNFVSGIVFRKKTMPLGSSTLERMHDFILWYSRSYNSLKIRQLFLPLRIEGDSHWSWLELHDKTRRKLLKDERSGKSAVPDGSKRFQLISMYPPSYSENSVYTVELEGKRYRPRRGACWITSQEGMQRLIRAGRVMPEGDVLRYVLYEEDFSRTKLTSIWADTIGVQGKRYVVETNENVVQRCLLMTTDPGDLLLDPTCGGGTTAYVAEQWGRRWITCDTSRVAITLAKQRLMTAVYDYYELARPKEGVGSGFQYKTVPHITLKSIANNEPPAQETLYDQPLIDRKKTRVSGPFTVEAVPAPAVKSIDEILDVTPQPADSSIARSGETLRQSEWRDELLRTGIRGKAGQRIRFARLEPLPGCRWLHADGETRPNDEGADSVRESAPAYNPMRVAVSFGPEYAPLEQRQVELAIDEAQMLVPRPKLIAFAAFQFDPEAAKDIDETQWPGVTLLKVQMNADLLTEDLKKKRASNESFWLIGQPDVTLRKIQRGEHRGKWEVEVYGFDYYNTKTGGIESGGADKIAIWLLDTDYDGRSLFPRQVFFPQAGESEGWAKLARNLKAEIDEDLIEAYRGTVSLPFDLDDHSRVAVKIVDDRGVESLKVIDVK